MLSKHSAVENLIGTMNLALFTTGEGELIRGLDRVKGNILINDPLIRALGAKL